MAPIFRHPPKPINSAPKSNQQDQLNSDPLTQSERTTPSTSSQPEAQRAASSTRKSYTTPWPGSQPSSSKRSRRTSTTASSKDQAKSWDNPRDFKIALNKAKTEYWEEKNAETAARKRSQPKARLQVLPATKHRNSLVICSRSWPVSKFAGLSS